MDDFNDYSTILMNLEEVTKKLHDKCLHKNYDGFMDDIGEGHRQLTKLLIWILGETKK
jgi:hypothetical protein